LNIGSSAVPKEALRCLDISAPSGKGWVWSEVAAYLCH
jgi:hypothetical protein